jgi:hypothetical protein
MASRWAADRAAILFKTALAPAVLALGFGGWPRARFDLGGKIEFEQLAEGALDRVPPRAGCGASQQFQRRVVRHDGAKTPYAPQTIRASRQGVGELSKARTAGERHPPERPVAPGNFADSERAEATLGKCEAGERRAVGRRGSKNRAGERLAGGQPSRAQEPSLGSFGRGQRIDQRRLARLWVDRVHTAH